MSDGTTGPANGFGIEAHSLLAIRRLCERTPGLERLWIFGSRARGDFRQRSDIDLVADAPGWAMRDALDFADALKHLPMVYPVDCAWWQDAGMQGPFREQVERDRQLLWAPRRHPVQGEAVGTLSLKKFQSDALDAVTFYLQELKRHAAQSEVAQSTLRAMDNMEDLAREVGDFPKKTWAALRSQNALPASFAEQPHSSRFDGAGRAIPNVCLKVPTGGGKTLLAAAAIGSVFTSWLQRHTGLVLWVVPNEAIYRQTFKALSNRDHPYRQLLNLAGAGRVKLLEKGSPLSRMDTDSNLCVMLLMLQSAARQSKETLRFFRDRGNVLGFLPRDDDIEAHWELLRAVPNLDAYAGAFTSAAEARAQKGSIAKSSLGNVMRLLRPMVVIDEGHHGYSENALRTIDGFNPSFLLELSATPRRASSGNSGSSGSNILVDVRGTDLDEAEMIKLPIDVEVRRWADWQTCLAAAVQRLDALQTEASALQAETARYIRPILLVQVERTGTEALDSGCIHAEHAKAFLLQLGFTPAQIAIKTSEKNDLSAPENIDLLSPQCEVRAIITKQALQEGWDCPFAYVLCALAAARSKEAMTQLVGRILRLPHVAKTGRAALDGCWVLCHDANTADVVRSIKKSLEQEGMGDLAINVRGDSAEAPEVRRVELVRRPEFAGLRLFVPRVTCVDADGTRRELEYDSDILAHVPWPQLRASALATSWAPDLQARQGTHLQLDLSLLGPGSTTATPDGAASNFDARVDRALLVRSLIDLVPNAWWLWGWLDEVLRRLLAAGLSEGLIANSSATLVEQLRVDLEAERDRLAQDVFDVGVASGRIEFRLRADRTDYELAHTQVLTLTAVPAPLMRGNGLEPVAKSLLEPALRLPDMNSFEAQFAAYLDERAALRWWHRNVAKTQYGLQGWKRHRVYPDFVFGMVDGTGRGRVVVLETKGAHLANADTAYKQTLLARLSQAWRDDSLGRAGELALAHGDAGANADELVCDLLFDQGWRGSLDQRYFSASDRG